MTKSTFEVAGLAEREAHELLIGLVVPRPIGWIGSISPGGVRNLAPFSFFNGVAGDPPTVMFSAVHRAAGVKDTLANVEATGEFTVSVVTEDVGDAMNVTSGSHPPDVDEFEIAGLTPVSGRWVRAPMVAEARANLECRLATTVPIGRVPAGSTVVIGVVLGFHVDEALLDGTRVDQDGLRAIGRMGGPFYTRTREIFGMERPP